MSRKQAKISSKLIEDIFIKQRRQCFWCGAPYGNHNFNTYTVDHLIPIAVYNWTKELYDHEDNRLFFKSMNSGGNLVISCGKCNVRKNCSIVEFEEVKRRCSKLKIDLTPYKEFYNANGDRIDTYKYLIKQKVKEQNNLCMLCGKGLIRNQMILRMIRNGAGSVINSSGVFCYRCNLKMKDMSYEEYVNHAKS